MHAKALSPLGVRVTDLLVGAVDPDDVDELRRLLADHGVLILADQQVDDAGFVAFLERFGPLLPSVGEIPVPGAPELNLVSNVGRTTPPKSQFHVDTSYVDNPPAYTALRAVAIPEQGGQTLFTNQYRAHSTLPDGLRRDLAGRTITHVVTGVELPAGEQSQAEHPVFREHPLSGRTTLYLSTPQRCRAVSGMSQEQSDATVAALLAHSTRAENIYRHSWSPGDIVMWDNLAVLHKADYTGVVGDRVMHRGMVADYGVL